MSYILDALKKADTERERRAVPGLNAQADAGFGISERRGVLPWRLFALGVAVLLAALFAWLWYGRDEATAPPTPAPVSQPSLLPQPVPAPPTAQAPAWATPPTVVQEPIAHTRAPVAPAAKPPATAQPQTAAAQPASGAAARLPSRNELPPDLRAALPALNVSGAVYAPQASARMLFVNGLVLREGDAVAEGLTVERIGTASSVLVFRGQRFELRH